MSTVNLYNPRKCTNANFNVKQKSLKALESFVPTLRKLSNGRLGGLAIRIRRRMQKPVTDKTVSRDLGKGIATIAPSSRTYPLFDRPN